MFGLSLSPHQATLVGYCLLPAPAQSENVFALLYFRKTGGVKWGQERAPSAGLAGGSLPSAGCCIGAGGTTSAVWPVTF